MLIKLAMFALITLALVGCGGGGESDSGSETDNNDDIVTGENLSPCVFAGEYAIENSSNDPLVPSTRFAVEPLQPCTLNIETPAGYNAIVDVANNNGIFTHQFDTSGNDQGSDVGRVSMTGSITNEGTMTMQICALDFDVCTEITGTNISI